MRAKAKLNLWLHVLAREESGYHGIETLFHRIDLADDVVIALAPHGERSIECSADVGPAHENLAYRAAQLYCEQTGWTTGFHVTMTKRIPARGGLGGGSADAAAVLTALNEMSPRRLDELELATLGTQLGADVPFLLTGAPCALAWSHGERMLKLPALPQRHVALVIPEFGIGTAEAYASLVVAARPRAQLTMHDLGNWDVVAARAGNDLSHSRPARGHEELAGAISALRAAGSIMAEMTGSGSVLFGIFESAPDAGALESATGCAVLLSKTAVEVPEVVAVDRE